MQRFARLALGLAFLLVPTLALAEPQPPSEDPFGSIPVVAKNNRRPARAARSLNHGDTGLAPDFTWGLSLPVSRFGFSRNTDGSYGGNVTPIQPGVGASLYWNVVRSANGAVPLAIGTTLFGATDLSSKLSDSGLGIAIGPSVFNNTFGLMVGVDLYRRVGNQDTGLLMANAGGQNGFARQNVFILFNFGIGLGKSAPGSLKIAP